MFHLSDQNGNLQHAHHLPYLSVAAIEYFFRKIFNSFILKFRGGWRQQQLKQNWLGQTFQWGVKNQHQQHFLTEGFLNGPSPASFIVYLRSFQTNITIFTTNNVKNCPSSIQYWDSNPQP